MNYAVIFLVSTALAVPMTFFAVGLPVVMRESGVPLTLIGLTALVYLPYALVFLWAPIVDGRALNRWGRRRSWIMVPQLAAAALIVLAALLSPSDGVLAVLAVATIVSFFGATQRTALLGFALETLSPARRPWGSALLPAGGALGAVIGASGLLFLYGRVGWTTTMLTVAGLAILFLLPLFLTEEPEPQRETSGQSRPSLKRFFKRRDIRPVIAFLAPLAFGVGLGFGMLQPRLVDMGFTLDQIGMINGVFTCAALLTGGPLAAFFISRYGLAVALPLGVVVNVAILIYAAGGSLLGLGPIHGAAGAVLFYLGFSFIGVMTNTIFMNHSQAGQEGTDFTVFICVYWLLSMAGIACSGVIADHFGYAAAFLSGALSVLVSLGLIRRLPLGRREQTATA